MTINHIKLMNNALEQNLPDDHNGFTNEVWFNAALAAMAEVERRVREECAAEIRIQSDTLKLERMAGKLALNEKDAEIERLRRACELAEALFIERANFYEAKNTASADKKAQTERFIALTFRNGIDTVSKGSSQ
jgi:LPS O-antigen subunit length determinant protein (WzzB/FepE family)